MSLRWYLRRLQAMEPAEILQRATYEIRKQAWARRRVWTAPRPRGVPRSPDPWNTPSLPTPSQLSSQADAYLGRRLRVLNLPREESPLDWHREPRLGVTAPLGFAPAINYRDPALVGSVKNIWEKSRHHHLSLLAAAFHATGDERYADEVADQLLDWLDKNPTMQGVNWSSGLELGIRLISWVYIERLLRRSRRHGELFGPSGVLWESVYWHQWAIAAHPSPGSSANNHVIGEMAGLQIAALAWPYFPESPRWRTLATRILEEQAPRQTYPSGLNVELAFSYHQFVLEFLLVSALETRRAGTSMSPAFEKIIQDMAEAIVSIQDCRGNLPRFGDDDEGIAIQLGPRANRTDAILSLARSRFKAGVAAPATTFEAEILAHGVPASEPPPTSELRNAWPDAGLYLLTNARGAARETYCLFDAGPLGFGSIAAHGHADALSFVLHVGGQPVLIDPGTYVYHGDNAWRNYFRSTKAHNTISLDNADQSTHEGLFLWTRKATTRALAYAPSPSGGAVTAEHDGYSQLPGKPIHRRSLTLEGDQLAVEDTIAGGGAHHVAWRLHFHPDCNPTLTGDICRVTWKDGSLEIRLPRTLAWHLLRGEAEGGWYSPAFNVKEPTTTLVGNAVLDLPVELVIPLVIRHES